MNKTTEFIIIKEADANELYQLNEHLPELFRPGDYTYENHIKNYLFLVAEGDVYYDGHLHLDYKDAFVDSANHTEWRNKFNIQTPPSGDYGIRGIIVNGNLEINGSLINKSMNDGPFLFITGDLKCRNLIAGGAYIQINGNADVEEIFYAHYNDGIIDIKQDLRAAVCISEDHCFSAKTIAAEFSYNSHSYTEIRLKEDKNGNFIIPKKLKPLLANPNYCWEDILEFLCLEGSLLKNSPYIKEKSEEEWLDFVQKGIDNYVWLILKKVPELKRTEAVCLKAIQYYGNNFEFVPKTLINKKFCEEAVKSSSKAFKFIPEKWIDQDLCELGLQFQKGYALEFMPEKFKTYDFCMKAAKCETWISFLPTKLTHDKALLIEVVKHNSSQFNELPVKYRKDPDLMLACLMGSTDFMNGYDNIKFYAKNQNDMTGLLKDLIKTDVTQIKKIPGYALSEALFNFADALYRENPLWPEIQKQHSTEFWKHRDGKAHYIAELEKDPKHKDRYAGAFEEVWSVFWNDDFLVQCIETADPYCEAQLIPEAFFTKKVISALMDNDKYGYYFENLPKKLFKKGLNSVTH